MNKNPLQFNRAFTLVELIVVMVIMTILAGLSAMAYRGIADDLRMSSAMNTVVSALDNARAMSIKKNRYVITVFRPRLESGGTEQVIDIVIAEWNGDSASADNGGSGTNTIWTYDRFIPIQGMAVRTIEGGVNVAGPGYGTGDDDTWWCSTFLPAHAVTSGSEPWGALVGVLYNPEGKVVVRNAESGADRIWVDFNRDWVQTINASEDVDWTSQAVVVDWTEPLPGIGAYFNLEIPDGEPFISMTPILAVFNESEMRSSVLTSDWGNDPEDSYLRDKAYTDFIEQNADRIQFNRYSGVPLK